MATWSVLICDLCSGDYSPSHVGNPADAAEVVAWAKTDGWVVIGRQTAQGDKDLHVCLPCRRLVLKQGPLE